MGPKQRAMEKRGRELKSWRRAKALKCVIKLELAAIARKLSDINICC
jgi:hypothetical protein